MLFILLPDRFKKIISNAAHAGTGLHFVIKVCFCFAVCAPISPLSLSAKSASCRFEKKDMRGSGGVNEFHLPCLTGRDCMVWSEPD